MLPLPPMGVMSSWEGYELFDPNPRYLFVSNSPEGLNTGPARGNALAYRASTESEAGVRRFRLFVWHANFTNAPLTMRVRIGTTGPGANLLNHRAQVGLTPSSGIPALASCISYAQLMGTLDPGLPNQPLEPTGLTLSSTMMPVSQATNPIVRGELQEFSVSSEASLPVRIWVERSVNGQVLSFDAAVLDPDRNDEGEPTHVRGLWPRCRIAVESIEATDVTPGLVPERRAFGIGERTGADTSQFSASLAISGNGTASAITNVGLYGVDVQYRVKLYKTNPVLANAFLSLRMRNLPAWYAGGYHIPVQPLSSQAQFAGIPQIPPPILGIQFGVQLGMFKLQSEESTGLTWIANGGSATLPMVPAGQCSW